MHIAAGCSDEIFIYLLLTRCISFLGNMHKLYENENAVCAPESKLDISPLVKGPGHHRCGFAAHGVLAPSLEVCFQYFQIDTFILFFYKAQEDKMHLLSSFLTLTSSFVAL